MSTTFTPAVDDTRDSRVSDDAVGWTEIRTIFGKVTAAPDGHAA